MCESQVQSPTLQKKKKVLKPVMVASVLTMYRLFLVIIR
jgi:hypothetical protein